MWAMFPHVCWSKVKCRHLLYVTSQEKHLHFPPSTRLGWALGYISKQQKCDFCIKVPIKIAHLFSPLCRESVLQQQQTRRKIFSSLTLIWQHKACINASFPFLHRMAINIGYFGLSLNTSNLSGNPFMNCFLSAAAEVPAYIVSTWLLKKCPRKSLLSAFLFIGGGVLLLIQFIPYSKSHVITENSADKMLMEGRHWFQPWVMSVFISGHLHTRRRKKRRLRKLLVVDDLYLYGTFLVLWTTQSTLHYKSTFHGNDHLAV